MNQQPKPIPEDLKPLWAMLLYKYCIAKAFVHINSQMGTITVGVN